MGEAPAARIGGADASTLDRIFVPSAVRGEKFVEAIRDPKPSDITKIFRTAQQEGHPGSVRFVELEGELIAVDGFRAMHHDIIDKIGGGRETHFKAKFSEFLTRKDALDFLRSKQRGPAKRGSLEDILE